MRKMLKKYKKEEKILTNEELEAIKWQISFIQQEFKILNAMYEEKAYDKYYFEKSKKYGNDLDKYKKRLKEGLIANKKMREKASQC